MVVLEGWGEWGEIVWAEYTSVGQKHLKYTSVDNDFIFKCTAAHGTPTGSSNSSKADDGKDKTQNTSNLVH